MSKHCCGSGCRSGERETKAENIRLAGKGRERCAGGKEEKEGQSSVFFLHPDEIRHELPGHRVSGADSAEHLPVLASQDLLFGSKRDSLKSQAAVMASALMELELLTSDQVERS